MRITISVNKSELTYWCVKSSWILIFKYVTENKILNKFFPNYFNYVYQWTSKFLSPLYTFLKVIKVHELHIDRFIKYVTRKLLCRIYVLILILETIY